MLFEDQLAALESESKKLGTQGANLDFALLLDGLTAEREQGITIDVAYRYFSTDRRKFIVADTPGHEQYTRNMVTGASTADCAVVLIDARKGVLTQTRRHSYLVSLLGIRHIALAVNKMDLVDYSQERFEEIEAAYRVFAGRDRHGGRHLHPALGLDRRERRRAERGDALVRRPGAAAVPRGRRGGRRAHAARAVPVARAVGEPPGSRLPRLRRDDRRRHGRARRPHRRPAVRADQRGGADRDLRRRSRACRRGAVDHAHACGRDRHQPGRRHRPRRLAARSGRPVRVHDHLDGGRADAPRPQLPHAHRRSHGDRDDHAAEVQAQRQLARAARGDEARPQRDRRLRDRARPADRVRPLRREPRDRRLHPDRPDHERHGRRGPAALRAAPRRQRPLAGDRRRQGRARAAQRGSGRASSG